MTERINLTPSVEPKAAPIYDRVRRDILTLVLAPDAVLRLSVLAARYNVGLTPLRECLNRLCTDQLVVPEHNKGFRVAGLARADLLDLERTRSAIDGAMMTDAIRDGNDHWEAQVIGTYHQLSATPFPHSLSDLAALETWMSRHAAFHAALVAGSGSTWLAQMRRQIEDHLGRYQTFILDELRNLQTADQAAATRATAVFTAAMAVEPHQALYHAAIKRDVAAAIVGVEVHAQLSIQAFEKLTGLVPAITAIAETLGPTAGAAT